ncbi:MAG: BamA/TamA family outer membrane protein [Halioglobus sp.]
MRFSSTTLSLCAAGYLLTSFFTSHSALARPPLQVKTAVTRAENTNPRGQTLVLPYAFNSESTDLVFGVGGMRKGFYQDQMTLGGLVFAGEDSHAAFAGVWDYRLPFSRRTFISASGMYGYYPNHRAYSLPRQIPVPAGKSRPGSNESSDDVFLESSGYSNWLDIKIEYALPMGASKDKGMVSYDLERGLLVSEPSGGEVWDPRSSGATVVGLRQYNRYQSYETLEGDYDGVVHAFELGLLYDNTDFSINPSQGSSQYVAYHNDPGWGSEEGKWDFLELEASKYFSLGSTDWARQRIIALNAWTGYSPSWELEPNGQGGRRVVDGPPFLEGATLGGFYRMRGYRDSRFHDKASVYATAEYRYTLEYNPIRNVSWLRFLHLDWIQVVGFVEAGRVAPEYKLDTLFDDMKSDVGIGLRALTGGVVVRADVAVSDEGTNFWVMVGHPF